MLMAVMDSKMKGKRTKGRPRLRWLVNIDSHLKGKNTSLKEVLETKYFENRKDWRTPIDWRRSLNLYLEYDEQSLRQSN